jgi:hypothetical protein
MAATIKIKNSSTASAVPTSSDLVQGELAVNVTDKRLFTENASGTVVELGTNPTILTMGAAGSASAPVITRTGDTNTGIFFPAADTIAFAEGGVEAMRLDSSGRVGIGSTPTPAAYQNINGYFQNGRSGWAYVVDDSANTHLVHNIIFNGTNNTFAGTGYASRMSIIDADGSFRWYQAGTGSAGGTASLSTRMTLDASGRLGIGTTSPLSTLVVSNGSSENIEFGSGNVSLNGGFIQYLNRSSGTTRPDMNYYLSSGGGAHKFYTNDLERARIDSSGNLLVGTTTTTGNGAAFQVAGSGGGMMLRIAKAAEGTAHQFAVNSSVVGSIYAGPSSTSYNTSSDYRLKNTVTPMTGALAKVAALKPCTYKWNVDGSDGEGFIAHELAEVVPQCVTGEKDAVDEEGNPVYQGIDTSFLVATLTAAIQELKAEFDAYKASHP